MSDSDDRPAKTIRDPVEGSLYYTGERQVYVAFRRRGSTISNVTSTVDGHDRKSRPEAAAEFHACEAARDLGAPTTQQKLSAATATMTPPAE